MSRKMFRIFFQLVVLCCCAIDLLAQKAVKEVNADEIAKGNSVIAITGARIIDGNGGAPVENGTVVVIIGRIADVGAKE